jgi:hypothetical protein
MGIRKTALDDIKDLLDGLALPNEQRLTATRKLFDPEQISRDKHPVVAVVPDPHNIILGLYGQRRDNDLRIGIYGYALGVGGEDAEDAAEDLIQAIVDELTTGSNGIAFCQAGFSIEAIGGIVCEQYDDEGRMAYIAIPLTIIFTDSGPDT